MTLDARLLVITGDGKSSSFAAITSALDYLGTPYDVFNAGAGPELTADTLAAGDHGRYYGVILDTGDLAVGSTSAFRPRSGWRWPPTRRVSACGARCCTRSRAASYGLQVEGRAST